MSIFSSQRKVRAASLGKQIILAFACENYHTNYRPR